MLDYMTKTKKVDINITKNGNRLANVNLLPRMKRQGILKEAK